MKAFEKTGASKAWESDFQAYAVRMQNKGELFSGSRQEDAPFGQELDALDLDGEAEADLPAGAPPKPAHKNVSPQALFISETRVWRKASTGARTLTDVDTALKKEWKEDMSAQDKATWKSLKKTRDAEFKTNLKKWRVEIKKLRKAQSSSSSAAEEQGATEEEEEEEEEEEGDEEVQDDEEDDANDDAGDVDDNDNDDNGDNEEDPVDRGAFLARAVAQVFETAKEAELTEVPLDEVLPVVDAALQAAGEPGLGEPEVELMLAGMEKQDLLMYAEGILYLV